jgi:hypothetical protein
VSAKQLRMRREMIKSINYKHSSDPQILMYRQRYSLVEVGIHPNLAIFAAAYAIEQIYKSEE